MLIPKVLTNTTRPVCKTFAKSKNNSILDPQTYLSNLHLKLINFYEEFWKSDKPFSLVK